MTYSIKVYNSVSEINPTDWNQLGDGHQYSSYCWYSFGEAVLPEDKPVYLLVESEGKPVARATFWIKYGDLLPLSSWRLTRVVNAYLSRRPIMICHSPFAGVDGLILPDGNEREEIFNLILDEAEQIARREKVSFLVLDYLPENIALGLTHRGKLFPLKLSEPGTVLPLQWDSFDEYVKHLSSSERKNVRRARNKVKKMGVEVRAEETVSDIDKALSLISSHDESYHTDVLPWLRKAFEHIQETESAWLGAYDGEKLVGCGLLLADDGVWFATALGRDYDYPFVYFVLGYESIRQAILHGGKAIRWGTGNYAYKERLGFELEDNFYVSFKAQNRVLDWLLRRVAGWIIN